MKLCEIALPHPIEWRGLKFDGSDGSLELISKLRNVSAIWKNLSSQVQQKLHDKFKSQKTFSQSMTDAINLLINGEVETSSGGKHWEGYGKEKINGFLSNDLKIFVKPFFEKNQQPKIEKYIKALTHTWDEFINTGNFPSLENGIMEKMIPPLYNAFLTLQVDTVRFMVENDFSEQRVKDYICACVDVFGKQEFLSEVKPLMYGYTHLTEHDFTEPKNPKIVLCDD